MKAKNKTGKTIHAGTVVYFEDTKQNWFHRLFRIQKQEVKIIDATISYCTGLKVFMTTSDLLNGEKVEFITDPYKTLPAPEEYKTLIKIGEVKIN
jgi:kynureninase